MIETNSSKKTFDTVLRHAQLYVEQNNTDNILELLDLAKLDPVIIEVSRDNRIDDDFRDVSDIQKMLLVAIIHKWDTHRVQNSAFKLALDTIEEQAPTIEAQEYYEPWGESHYPKEMVLSYFRRLNLIHNITKMQKEFMFLIFQIAYDFVDEVS